MKNVTLSLPDDLLQLGREYAKTHHTSLNELIREVLKKTVAKPAGKDWLEECFKMMDKAKASSRGKKWKREDLYDI